LINAVIGKLATTRLLKDVEAGPVADTRERSEAGPPAGEQRERVD